MRFDPPLEPVTFQRRYKRFLADVVRADGAALTVHCANPGAMTGCQPTGGQAWISDSHNPKRKLRHSLEVVGVEGARICVNTARANAVVHEALVAGAVAPLAGFDALRAEVAYGAGSRVDFLLGFGDRRCYLEVKSVTLSVGAGVSRFPDAVSARATRHLLELSAMVEAGHRAVLLFCSSRDDTRVVGPADHIDPVYGRALRAAAAAGVEILAYRCDVGPEGVWLRERVPVDLSST